MSTTLKKLLALGFLVLLCSSAFAEVHKWVDDQGVVHYSDSPPADSESELIEINPTVAQHADDSVSQVTEWVEQQAKYRAGQREAKFAADQVEADERLVLEQRCVDARKQLISLQQKLPVYRDEEGIFRTRSWDDAYAGKREYLDDATRALEVDRVQQEINAVCEHPDDRIERFLAGRERKFLKRCETAREQLEQLLRSGARSARQEIEQKRQLIEHYCVEENSL